MVKNALLTIVFVLSFLNTQASKERWDYDKSDWSKLMIASYRGNHKRICRLIEKGVNVNYKSKDGITALEISIRKQDTIATNILINSKKIIINDSGYIVMLACSLQSVEILKMILSYGYPIKNLTSNYTPLMAACSFGSIKIVEHLISIGQDVNAQRDVDGMTPLMFATYNGAVEKVKLLLIRKADKLIRDKDGKTAYDYINTISDNIKNNENIQKEMRELLK